jgi:P27 family predicted phage terminase small subunit
MTMPAGRKPKPTHLHLVEGTFNVTRHSKRLKSEPKPVGNLHEPPQWFNDGQREVWAYGLRHAPMGLLKAIDLSTYVAWCVACDTHRQAAEHLAKMGVKGLLAPASRGSGLIQSPLVGIMNRQALIMLKHASELGFTPVGRARVAVDPTAEVNPFDEFG